MINFRKFINENINEAFNFSKEEVLKVAHLVAHAIEKLDKAPTRVHDLEYDKGRGAGFGIQMYADQFAGGSYSVRPNGEVVNDAIGNSFPNAIYAKIGDTDVKKVMKNIQKFESVTNEAVEPQIAKIASFTGTRATAVEDFVSAHALNITKLLKFVQKGSLKDRMDFVAALAGTPGNKKQKQIIKMFSESVVTEAKKFYNTKEIVKMSNAAGDIVVDAKFAIQDLAVAYGDKVPAKELDKVLANYDLEIEDLMESVVTEGKGFKNTEDFEDFLEEIDGMGEAQIKKIMGKDYIDTPGFYQDEKDDYEDIIDFMISNMGRKEFEKLQDWWESNVAESAITEGKKVTLKRRYTENYPAITVGKHARIRNKMLEAIGNDGKITQEEFDSILKELSNSGKRWSRNNAKYFNVSEEGISLSKFGKRALQSITVNEEQPETNDKPLEMKVNEKLSKDKKIDGKWYSFQGSHKFEPKALAIANREWGSNMYDTKVIKDGDKYSVYVRDINEATTKNPEIWVPGAFDKELSKMPNNQITYDVVKKLAKKHKVFLDDAIKYVEYGWDLDLQENMKTNIETQFIHESFNDFVNTLGESQSYASTFGGSSEKIDAAEIKKALKKAGYKTDTGGFWDRIFVKKGSNKIAMINTSDNMYRFNNSFYKWNGLNDFINHVSESVNEGKFQKDDLVYNTRTKTVGIVRIGDDEYGEVKTDADGNVDVDELEKYNPIKFKHQTKAKVAPSTEKEVSKRGLFNPFKNESVNEAKYTNQTGIKSALMKDSNFSSLLNPKEIKWINGSDVKIYKGIGMNFSFTDGKSQMIVNVNKPMSIVKKLGRVGDDIKKIYQQNESVITESITKKDIKVGAEFQVGKDIFKVDEIEKDSKFGALVRSSRIESTSDKKYSYRDSMEEFVAFLNDEKAKIKK